MAMQYKDLAEAMVNARSNTNKIRYKNDEDNNNRQRFINKALIDILIKEIENYGTQLNGYIIYPELKHNQFMICKRKSWFSTPSIIFVPPASLELRLSDDTHMTFNSSHELHKYFSETFKYFAIDTFNTLCEDCLILHPKVLGKVLKSHLMMKF